MTNSTKVQVRYAETDQMGVVYYANFFIWMEIGRTNLFKESGMNYRELEEKGFILPVSKACAKYISPAFYDDEIEILSTFTRASGSRIRVDYRMMRGTQPVCHGYTEHALVLRETRKVVPIPEDVLANIQIPENVDQYITKI